MGDNRGIVPVCVDSIQQYFVLPLKGHVVGGIYVYEDEEEKRGRREEGKERRVHRQITGEASFLIWISSFPEWSRNVAKLRQLASSISPLPNLS